MKSLLYAAFILFIMAFFSSCSLFEEDDPNTLGGDQSPMGEVGTAVSSSSIEISGVSGFEAEVTSLKDGVSTYKGKAVCRNTFLKNLLLNFPDITPKGDTLTTTNLQFKQTKDGLELKSGPTKGIIMKYGAEVGDKFAIEGSSGTRNVVSKSTTDDFSYGFYLIKVVEIEEYPTLLRGSGVNKITYWGNHKYGLVSVDFSFDDGTSAQFPLYTSSEN